MALKDALGPTGGHHFIINKTDPFKAQIDLFEARLNNLGISVKRKDFTTDSDCHLIFYAGYYLCKYPCTVAIIKIKNINRYIFSYRYNILNIHTIYDGFNMNDCLDAIKEFNNGSYV